MSIIVPAYREASNLEALVRRAFAALSQADLVGEMIIVDDDSRDGTTAVMERLAGDFPVHLFVRTGVRGLASAVVYGLERARHDILVVMDADLQHPPESIPVLVDAVLRGADLAVGSRHVPGAEVAADWSGGRRLNSLVATILARPLVTLRDPMSGFCAFPRDTLERAERLNPIGYKFVLELAVKARSRRCVEVPIAFASRAAGSSKLSIREQGRYLCHIANLYWFRFRRIILLTAAALTLALAYLAFTGSTTR